MRTRMALLTTTALVGAALLLTACTSDAQPAPPGDEGATREGVTLIMYSNSVSDGRGEWLVDRAAAEGFTIEFVDMGGGEAQNRLIAEKNNPVADIVFGPSNVQFANLKNGQVLEPYEPEWAGEVAEYVDPDEDASFWPVVREPIMLVYNTAKYTEEEAPEDWPDLWENEKFHGLYETPTDLGGGTTRMVITSILAPYFDEDGLLGVADEGWEAIEQFFANGNPAVEGTDLYARISAGDVNAGQMFLAGKFSREEEYGVETEAAHPSSGVPIVYQNIGLVAGSDHAEVAQQFIDWFGGAETQAAWSQEFFTVPTNEAAMADATPEAVEYTDSFEEQDIDWSVVAENLDAWVEEIELNYVSQ